VRIAAGQGQIRHVRRVAATIHEVDVEGTGPLVRADRQHHAAEQKAPTIIAAEQADFEIECEALQIELGHFGKWDTEGPRPLRAISRSGAVAPATSEPQAGQTETEDCKAGGFRHRSQRSTDDVDLVALGIGVETVFQLTVTL
jgi:hypothetical protein